MNTAPLRIQLYFVVAGVVASSFTVATAENFSLSERFTSQTLQEMLLPRDDWQPFPVPDDRRAWDAVPAEVRATIIELAEQRLRQVVPSLPATLYLQFQRNGNRSNYQDLWFERRVMLHELVLAECLENEGRFVDAIADVVWAICEESSWTFPAHISRQRAGVGLPDTTEPVVALFSAETGSSLAWTSYLLKDRLDVVSPQIAARIQREVDARILTPFLERDDFSWMGFAARRAGRYPNNWNPWVNSNVLAAGLLVEADEARRLEIVCKVLSCLDNFLVPYPSDGSCDEGPSYWTRAGASLFDNLELLHSATGGSVDVYHEPVVADIGRFIYRTHIADDYFVCIGDCDARISIPRELAFRYGQRIQDSHLSDLAVADLDLSELIHAGRGLWSLGRALHTVLGVQSLLSAPKATPPFSRDVWLGDQDMQLMAARDREGSAEGWFVAAWAGHNGQSHNHNDVGNFVVFADGRPVLIDVGRPTYTRQTFSRDRYQIWSMQSAYHNLPNINGVMQSAGRKFAARDVRYETNDDRAQLTMDIAPSYHAEAQVESWRRTVRLLRGRQVEVKDDFQLTKPSRDVVVHLITPCTVTRAEAGALLLQTPDSGAKVRLSYQPNDLVAVVDTMELKDEKLRGVWGPSLRRIALRGTAEATKGCWSMQLANGE